MWEESLCTPSPRERTWAVVRVVFYLNALEIGSNHSFIWYLFALCTVGRIETLPLGASTQGSVLETLAQVLFRPFLLSSSPCFLCTPALTRFCWGARQERRTVPSKQLGIAQGGLPLPQLGSLASLWMSSLHHACHQPLGGCRKITAGTAREVSIPQLNLFHQSFFFA